MHTWKPGDTAQTPLGKGVVRGLRNAGRAVVEINGRVVELPTASLVHASPRRKTVGDTRPLETVEPPGGGTREVDFHGLTVDAAVARLDSVLDQALRDDITTLRLIHGRSGGRLRSALHARLGELSVTMRVQIDPRNPGVTIVTL